MLICLSRPNDSWKEAVRLCITMDDLSKPILLYLANCQASLLVPVASIL